MADESTKRDRDAAKMPSSATFDRHAKRQDNEDDGDSSPHAGGDDTPASGAVARLQTAFAGTFLTDHSVFDVPAPLTPTAQPTPTVGVVPMESETTNAPAGGACDAFERLGEFAYFERMPEPATQAAAPARRPSVPREARANAEPTPAQPPAAARALRRSPRASPTTTPAQPPAAARASPDPREALTDAATATAPALLDDDENWDGWAANSQKVAALQRLLESLKNARNMMGFRGSLESCGFSCGPDLGGWFNVFPPQHLPPVIDVVGDQYSRAGERGCLESRPQLVAYLEGVLKRVADSKSDDDAMESAPEAPMEQEAVSSRLERARQDRVAAAAKLRASLEFGQALDIRYPATVAAAGSLSSGDDVGGTSASVGLDVPHLVVMGHGFSAAQDAYRREHGISEDNVFFNLNNWSAAPQHYLKATIRLINATPKQSATLSFTLCRGDGAAVDSPFGLDVLGALDCVVTSERDAVVCYRILDSSNRSGLGRTFYCVEIAADGAVAAHTPSIEVYHRADTPRFAPDEDDGYDLPEQHYLTRLAGEAVVDGRVVGPGCVGPGATGYAARQKQLVSAIMHRLYEEQRAFTGRLYSTKEQRGALHRAYCNPTDAEKVFCNICGCQCGSHLQSVIDHYFVKRIGGQIIYYWRRRRICWKCNAQFLEMIRRLGHTIVPTSLDLGLSLLDVREWYAVDPPANIPLPRTLKVRAAVELYWDGAYVFPRIGDAAAATRQWALGQVRFYEGQAAPAGGVVATLDSQQVEEWRAWCDRDSTRSSGAPPELPWTSLMASSGVPTRLARATAPCAPVAVTAPTAAAAPTSEGLVVTASQSQLPLKLPSRPQFPEPTLGGRVPLSPPPAEWAQCAACDKWRVLPANVSAASLSDDWKCGDIDVSCSKVECSLEDADCSCHRRDWHGEVVLLSAEGALMATYCSPAGAAAAHSLTLSQVTYRLDLEAVECFTPILQHERSSEEACAQLAALQRTSRVSPRAPSTSKAPARNRTTVSKPSSEQGKGKWTPEEDDILRCFVWEQGAKWSKIAAALPGRDAKHCRERWTYVLDPTLKKTPFDEDEDRVLLRERHQRGNKWAEIAKLLPGRTDMAVKNRWNSPLKGRFEGFVQTLDRATRDAYSALEKNAAPATAFTLDNELLARALAACRTRINARNI